MKRFLFIWAIPLGAALAQGPMNAPATNSAAAGAGAEAAKATAEKTAPVHYVLRDLKPVGITQYSFPVVSKFRQYLHFRNAQGSHYILYEEAASAEPLRDLAGLRTAMVNPDPFFRMEIECSMQAFCTADCKNMFYEMANFTPPPESGEQNNCRLISFTNEKPALDRAALNAPSFPMNPTAPGPAPASVSAPAAVPNAAAPAMPPAAPIPPASSAGKP